MKLPKKQTENHEIHIIPLSKLVNQNGATVPGIDVKSHCLLTGYVAEALLHYFPNDIVCQIPHAAVFYASAHDVGKLSPCFQKMIYSNLSGFNISEYPELEAVNSALAKRKETAFHGKVTETVFKSFLGNESTLATIEGMHHGFRPNIKPNLEDAYGGPEWTTIRHDLINLLKEKFLSDSDDIPEISDWNMANLLGGFITVADWIASGTRFSNLTQSQFDQFSKEELQSIASDAVEGAGFIPPVIRKGLSFEDLFGFKPRNVQKEFYESVDSPGVYILEAPMGLGKTEAALYAAYKMLESGLADGIYFGLPTQVTSNKIYERVKDFLVSVSGLPEEKVMLKLLHSSAWLETKDLGEDGVAGRSWFDDKKRAILAPFAVGTVDQALMAVMNVKHGMVRAFGLTGKVVILDEVHSYDSYTGTIINRLVEYLKDTGATVIILSATLNEKQKRNILQIPVEQRLSDAYPLITKKCDDGFIEKTVLGPEKAVVQVEVTEKEDRVIEEVLRRAERGEQILWIENTVSDAQHKYRKLAARCSGSDIECGLIHSRYTKERRSKNEEKWTRIYGKKGTSERSEHGRILVGTQVLEQSLDIDADFLVSRLCPTDMLLQRTGRLWRHKEHDVLRPQDACRKIIILSPSLADAEKKRDAFGLSSYVYDEYVLLRTLEEWEQLTEICVPDDIRFLINRTYSERVEVGHRLELKQELERQKSRLEGFARVGLSSVNQTLPESAVQTRYSELESTSVLLIRKLIRQEDSFILQFMDSEENFTVPMNPDNNIVIRKVARMLMEHTVTVSEKNAPSFSGVNESCFSPYVYLGKEDDQEHPFRVALVGKDSYLRDFSGNLITQEKKTFTYDNLLGYQINVRKED